MHPIARLLISLGVLLILAGVGWQFGGRFLRLGRLPGDIELHRENVHFYFPIVTSIVVSVVLSLILWLWRKLSG
jgi:hypothetical protein